MKDKVRSIIAEVFNVPLSEVNVESSAHTIPTWDSLKHIDLILALEKSFKIHFEDEEIATMINYQIIVNTIQAYLE